MKCRHCQSRLSAPLIDLGSAPPSNSFLNIETINAPEKYFPLRVLVCTNCWLVQTEDFAQKEELFDSEYAYFSGFSTSWLEHCRKYVNDIVDRFELNDSSHVIEVAANDGYLLQYVKNLNIPCTGIEPTASTAAEARNKGLNIIEEFFGEKLAKQLVEQGKQADLTVANNVLAHVPDINDFISGFAKVLKPNGVSTFEFPHLLKLISENQFDTIYHEHFSYLSLVAIENIFNKNGLQVFDVEELPTHGGSLRIFAQRIDTGERTVSERVTILRNHEIKIGVNSINFYTDFQFKANKIKDDLLMFLIDAKQKGKKIVLTNGFFDFIHSGQIDFLRKAKELGDVLVVAINSDRSARENKGEGRPILNEEERLNVLSSMDFVDYVVVFDELTQLNILSVLKPHILAKGGISYEEVIGRELVESFGGKVELIPLCGMSTSSLIEKVLKSYENKR